MVMINYLLWSVDPAPKAFHNKVNLSTLTTILFV
jgi:hypothetical protein